MYYPSLKPPSTHLQTLLGGSAGRGLSFSLFLSPASAAQHLAAVIHTRVYEIKRGYVVCFHTSGLPVKPFCAFSQLFEVTAGKLFPL